MINQPTSTAFYMKNNFWTKISKNGHCGTNINFELFCFSAVKAGRRYFLQKRSAEAFQRNSSTLEPFCQFTPYFCEQKYFRGNICFQSWMARVLSRKWLLFDIFFSKMKVVCSPRRHLNAFHEKYTNDKVQKIGCPLQSSCTVSMFSCTDYGHPMKA